MPTTSKHLMKPTKAAPSAQGRVRLNTELKRVLDQPDSKDYEDLRDRAAFVHITGTMPTHLRTHMTSLLRGMTVVRNEPTALDGQSGSMKIEPHVARSMRLDRHPMVAKVQEFLTEGYLVQSSREMKARRPFSRVFLYRDAPNGKFKMTIHGNGATQEGWDGME